MWDLNQVELTDEEYVGQESSEKKIAEEKLMDILYQGRWYPAKLSACCDDGDAVQCTHW